MRVGQRHIKAAFHALDSEGATLCGSEGVNPIKGYTWAEVREVRPDDTCSRCEALAT